MQRRTKIICGLAAAVAILLVGARLSRPTGPGLSRTDFVEGVCTKTSLDILHAYFTSHSADVAQFQPTAAEYRRKMMREKKRFASHGYLVLFDNAGWEQIRWMFAVNCVTSSSWLLPTDPERDTFDLLLSENYTVIGYRVDDLDILHPPGKRNVGRSWTRTSSNWPR